LVLANYTGDKLYPVGRGTWSLAAGVCPGQATNLTLGLDRWLPG
jgi:hypothetical protein